MKAHCRTWPLWLQLVLAIGCENPTSSSPNGLGGSAGESGGFTAGTAALPTAGTVAGTSATAGTGVAGHAQAGTGAAGVGFDTDGGVIVGPDGGSTWVIDPVGNKNRAPGFVDLSPPMGEPLPEAGSPVTPTPPAGWVWHAIEGTQCRDGSTAGIYVHKGTSPSLLVYLEGGGACSNNHYCTFNPASVDQVLAGDGQVVIGSTLGTGPGRQQPGVYTDGNHMGPPAGIFDTSKADNPFKDWSQVYIPYCTGDVHFGTKPNATVPGLTTPQQFVGHLNMKKFMGRIVPTFPDADRVIVAGSSAGGFGAALNFTMIQDSFGDIPVSVIDDSGPPFENEFMPVCMQKRWRAAWGLDGALPPDCEECFDADGGNILRLADFLLEKHPNAKVALISSINDEVIRLFFSVGLKDCANYDTADPVATVLFQADPTVFFPAAQYEGGLDALRTAYGSTGRYATYYMAGANVTYHEHLFRPRFYEAAAGGKSIAAFVSGFINGTIEQVGP